MRDLWNEVLGYSITGYSVVDELIIAAFILLIVYILGRILSGYVYRFILRLTSKTKTELDEQIWTAFEKPIRVFFVVLAFYLAIRSLSFVTFDDVLLVAFRSTTIILIAWGLFDLTGTSSSWIRHIGDRYDLQIDQILVPFLSKALRVVVLVIAFTVLVQEWGYDIDGLLAGIGLGGLAISLAAKDALANVFGGVVIITEKPFTLGDWIQTPSVEGTVEDISFRSTKVRTFAQGLVTVPNSTLANEPITNWSQMGKRRITFHLGVTYSTPAEKMEICVKRIRDMLNQHPDIHKETIFVNFERFNDSSLDIFLYFFTQTTNWGEYLQVREDCNLKIMKILEEEGVSVAFPSTSVYFENALRREDIMNPEEHPPAKEQ